MKRAFTLLLLVCGLSLSLIKAQDLSDFVLLAHYPLTDSAAADVTGNYGNMELTNTEFQGPEGIYANGMYIYSGEPDGSLISTPAITFPDSLNFAFSLEFKAAATDYRPIFVAGDSYRWLGAFVVNGQLQLLVNDILYETTTPVQTGQWYQLTLSSRQGDTRLYLDGQMAIQQQVDSITYSLEGAGLHRISNTHYGLGIAMQGNWRNLKIYGKDTGVNNREVSLPEKLTFYPNPTSGPLSIEFSTKNSLHNPCILRFMDEQGRIQLEKKVNPAQTTLDLNLHALPPGRYILLLSDSSGQVRVGKVILQSRLQ